MKRKIMEGKLVKTGNDYILYSKDNSVLGITSGTMEGRKLSLKNCQAIENGYDLDDLASERLSTRFNENSGYHKFVFVEAYKEGFNRAFEILGDKKFVLSEEDLHKVLDIARLQGGESFLVKHTNEEIIQSLQTKEWDVEIIMSEVVTDDIVGMAGIPKLDDDGCLILRRI